MMRLNERGKALWGDDQWKIVRLECVETAASVSHAQRFICSFFFNNEYKGCGEEAKNKVAAKESCAQFAMAWLDGNGYYPVLNS